MKGRSVSWDNILRAATAMLVAFAGACDNDASPSDVTPPREFTLTALGGSNVTGIATIEDLSGPTSSVRVELSGMAPNSAHVGHVHKGSCTQQGAIYHGLEVVSAGSNGTGSVVTTQVPDSLLTYGYYIQYHVAVAPPGAPIACGDLTG